MADQRKPFMDVKIGDKNLITKGIESIVVEDHDRLADKATVVVNDTSGIAADSIQNGQDITITMGWANEPATLFKGTIHQPASQTGAGGRPGTIVALDYSILMHLKTNPLRHDPGTLKDVLTAILNKPDYKAKIKI